MRGQSHAQYHTFERRHHDLLRFISGISTCIVWYYLCLNKPYMVRIHSKSSVIILSQSILFIWTILEGISTIISMHFRLICAAPHISLNISLNINQLQFNGLCSKEKPLGNLSFFWVSLDTFSFFGRLRMRIHSY